MFNAHFYHGTTKKLVAVFGTLFNNISVIRKDPSGAMRNIQRVPLAYGPKQKWLARIDEQKDLTSAKIAIKMPRMAFEIVGMTYDTTTKTNRANIIGVNDSTNPDVKYKLRNFAPYRLQFQLSILAQNQDDVLQILEQILPTFQPEYTVTIRDLDPLNIKTDIPIVLQGINISDDYEGDFLTRRAIIYTLDFEMRARYYSAISSQGVIKNSIIDFRDFDSENPIQRMDTKIDPLTAGPADQYNIVQAISFFEDTTSFYLTMGTNNTNLFQVGEIVSGNISGTTARVVSFTNNVLLVRQADGYFRAGETITGAASTTSRTLNGVSPTYDV